MIKAVLFVLIDINNLRVLDLKPDYFVNSIEKLAKIPEEEEICQRF